MSYTIKSKTYKAESQVYAFVIYSFLKSTASTLFLKAVQWLQILSLSKTYHIALAEGLRVAVHVGGGTQKASLYTCAHMLKSRQLFWFSKLEVRFFSWPKPSDLSFFSKMTSRYCQK